MLNKWVVSLGRMLAKNNEGFFQKKMLAYNKVLHHSANNFNCFDIQRNGEAWLVRKACQRLPIQYVMDIGANHGDWLQLAFQNTPAAKIIGCEPQPKLAALLMSNYKEHSRVTIIAAAVGDADGELDLHCYQGDDLANAFGWQHIGKGEIIKVPVRNGIELIQSSGWDRIDLLKIDVEGMEITVLNSFKEMLKQGKIGIVQFEFGAFSIQLRSILKDFYDLFGDHYRIGRLMPNSIAFTDYDFKAETSEFANYVACRNDWVEMMNT